MATVKENLIAAKALIDTPAKWIKGSFSKDGCYCALGAIFRSDQGNSFDGVLIDIDEATEGWQRDVLYPVAPCHPMWRKQQAEQDFDNDSLERLAAWGNP